MHKQKLIKSWIDKHRDFIEELEYEAYSIMRENNPSKKKFNAQFVAKALEENGFTHLPFTTGELFRSLKK